MSYFHRPDGGLEPPESREERHDERGVRSSVSTEDPPRSPFAEVAGRFANWISGADRIVGEQPQVGDEPGSDPIGRLTSPEPAPEPVDEPSRFPVAPFGYNRAAVDEHLIGLERELAELREKHEPTMSITEELERIGEQTASILVVAHDQAHETTRLAQEQADRCVADAAANAVAMTAEAKERLRQLDSETDSVWRERERLLDDVRVVSASLTTLADEASERFPAAEPNTGGQPTQAFPMVHGPWWTDASPGEESTDRDSPTPGAEPGDTGSWLAGFEPPDQSQ
jgi:hypothetical protein